VWREAGDKPVPGQELPHSDGQAGGQGGDVCRQGPGHQGRRHRRGRGQAQRRPLGDDDGAGSHVAEPLGARVHHRRDDGWDTQQQVDLDVAHEATDEGVPEGRRAAVVAQGAQPESHPPEAASTCQGLDRRREDDEGQDAEPDEQDPDHGIRHTARDETDREHPGDEDHERDEDVDGPGRHAGGDARDRHLDGHAFAGDHVVPGVAAVAPRIAHLPMLTRPAPPGPGS
jgi:hypothetical protein